MIAVLGVLIFTAAVCFIEMLRHRSREGMWMRRCMQLRNRMAANEAAIIERTASEAIQIAESVVNHKDCMCEKCLTASLIQHEIRNRFPSTRQIPAPQEPTA